MATPKKKPTAEAPASKKVTAAIRPPNFGRLAFDIIGISPLVMHKFADKAMAQMRATQEAGSTQSSGRTKKPPKDFAAQCEGATHYSLDGWIGVPATAFRCAMISACRLVDFTMTKAKCSIFIEADGYGTDGCTPLVRITVGEPVQFETPVRLAKGAVDIRCRPMWAPGWELRLRVRYDADQFKVDDVAALVMRAGLQIGILEGRPFSKESAGMGWGMFTIRGRENE